MPGSRNTSPTPPRRENTARKPNNALAPRTPSPERPRGVGSGGGSGSEYRVLVQEGDSKLQHPPATIDRFARLCSRETHGISKLYVRDVLRPAGKGRQFVMTLVRVSQPKTHVAFVQCSMYSTLPGIKAVRVVVVDLICTDPSEKGAGAVLLGELERYAATRLNANLLLLDAVAEPSVIAAYKEAGYARGMGPGTRKARAMLRYAAAMATDKNFQTADEEWLDALERELYPRNKTGDTVVMFKQVPAAMASEIDQRRVKWRDAVRAGNKERSGRFRGNNKTIAVARYVRNAKGWLTRSEA